MAHDVPESSRIYLLWPSKIDLVTDQVKHYGPSARVLHQQGRYTIFKQFVGLLPFPSDRVTTVETGQLHFQKLEFPQPVFQQSQCFLFSLLDGGKPGEPSNVTVNSLGFVDDIAPRRLLPLKPCRRLHKKLMDCARKPDRATFTLQNIIRVSRSAIL